MKSMILGISASPQKGGKVETLVREVLAAFTSSFGNGAPPRYQGWGPAGPVTGAGPITGALLRMIGKTLSKKILDARGPGYRQLGVFRYDRFGHQGAYGTILVVSPTIIY